MELIKKNMPIVISVIIAIIAGILIFTVLRAQAPTVPVVVASHNIRVGTILSSDVLTIKNMPATAVPNSSFRSINQVDGSAVINGPLIEGDILRSEHLTADGSLMATLKTFAPKGWTAVELPTSAGTGMVGLKKGDVVNLYGEVGSSQGSVVGEICHGAVIVSVPDIQSSSSSGEQSQSSTSGQVYIVGVPDEYAPALAEIIVRGKPMAITLPSDKNTVKAAAQNMAATLPVDTNPATIPTDATNVTGGN